MENTNVSKDDLKLTDNSKAYEQYMDTMSRMNSITMAMREEQPPAQAPPADDASVITHVVFIPEGGVFTYLAKYDLPFRGFPLNDTVQAVDELKKFAKIIIQKFVPYIKSSSIISKIRLVLTVDHFIQLAECYLYAYHWKTKRIRLKPYMYCQCVRELFDTINKSNIENPELKEAIRDCLCMFMEFDNAYRFRMQDILPEINVAAIKKEPIKEISRLLDLLMEREVWEEGKTKMAEKWKMAKELICLFLRFKPSIKKYIVDMVTRIDLKRIEPTKEDRYYCEFRKDYKFGFMTRENIPIREIPKGNVMGTIQSETPKVDNTLKEK